MSSQVAAADMQPLVFRCRWPILITAGWFLCTLSVCYADNRVASPTSPVGQEHLACQVLAAARGVSAAAANAVLSGEQKSFGRLQSLGQTLTDLLPAIRTAPALKASTTSIGRISERVQQLVLGQEAWLTAHQALLEIQEQSEALSEPMVALISRLLQEQAPPRNLEIAGSALFMLDRIGKSAAQWRLPVPQDPRAIMLLQKDADGFVELLMALRDGNAQLRLRRNGVTQTRERITQLLEQFEPMHARAQMLRSRLGDLKRSGELLAELQAQIEGQLDKALERSCMAPEPTRASNRSDQATKK